ncbi:PiggyBac transposable element-derived protein 4 [Cucumispora dikerogammari]|nr:PiggyBac transposable element-derived protein 4 [Cucumispora dikerogammari]
MVFINNYNNNMNGVDICDQYTQYYYINRKFKRWTMKFSLFLIDIFLLNSFVLYKKHIGKNVLHLDFNLAVVNWLYEQTTIDKSFTAFNQKKLVAETSMSLAYIHREVNIDTSNSFIENKTIDIFQLDKNNFDSAPYQMSCSGSTINIDGPDTVLDISENSRMFFVSLDVPNEKKRKFKWSQLTNSETL